MNGQPFHLILTNVNLESIINSLRKLTNFNILAKPLTEWAMEQQFHSGMNVLGLVVFAVALGSAISSTASDVSRPLVQVFRGLSAALMKITKWVIW